MGAGQTAIFEVAVESSLMDGRHGTKAHADGWELPELRHEPRVGIAGQALPTNLLSKVFDLFVRQPAFQPSACVDAGRCMPLPVQMVAGGTVVLASEEMIEADFPSVRHRSIGRDVAANAVKIFVRSGDHHHGVPTNNAVKAFFHGEVPGVGALIFGMNGVEVGGFHHLNVHACILCSLHRGVQQTPGFFLAPLVGYGTNGVTPFLGGNRVGVGLCGPSSKPHGVSPVVMGLW